MQTTLNILPKTFIAATSVAVTALRLQNISPHYHVFLQMTLTNNQPENLEGALLFSAGATLTSDLSLHNLFPAIVGEGGAGFLWLWADEGGIVSVSHA
ncbi:MAG: hypothetical protein K9G71_01345 [Rhodobacteraceae bacterium]|nr:hypothetical protein [Paracoccaceae bacterium]MCF8512972.1 hypothetical protein [Paracoccaceae bacterium]MCF8517217.1 hypothetical protein [Paracoccaceae bacterium]